MSEITGSAIAVDGMRNLIFLVQHQAHVFVDEEKQGTRKMKNRWKKHCQVAVWAIVTAFVLCGTALGQTTAFTYQGKLTVAGNSANASYDTLTRLVCLANPQAKICH